MWYDKFKDARILIHQSSGKDGTEHNKFWHGHFDEQTGKAYIRWGRLGTKGQSQTKDFGSAYAAAGFLDKKYREKRNKGYRDQIDGRPIDQSTLDRLHTEATIVGTGNKLSRFQWLEQTSENPPNFIEINEDRLYDPTCNPAKSTTRTKSSGVATWTRTPPHCTRPSRQSSDCKPRYFIKDMVEKPSKLTSKFTIL